MSSSLGEPPWSGYDALFLDLDGVVYRSGEPVPHAAVVLNELGARGIARACLTNNASRTPEEVAARVTATGVQGIGPGDVVTSAQAIAALMASELRPGEPVLVVGGAGLRNAVALEGLVPVDSPADDPVAVVQGFSPDVSWRELAGACQAITAGATWYASNLDLTIPTAGGKAPGNGSLVQVVRNVVGIDPIVAGKPQRPLFDTTLARTQASKPLMIGDRLDTDIAGASRAGLDSFLVLTGVTSLAELAELRIEQRPTWFGADLRALLDAHSPVVMEPGRSHCGSASAELVDGQILLTKKGVSQTDALRAIVELAWSVVDDGGHPRVLNETLDA